MLADCVDTWDVDSILSYCCGL